MIRLIFEWITTLRFFQMLDLLNDFEFHDFSLFHYSQLDKLLEYFLSQFRTKDKFLFTLYKSNALFTKTMIYLDVPKDSQFSGEADLFFNFVQLSELQ